jgi:hypothetical protein
MGFVHLAASLSLKKFGRGKSESAIPKICAEKFREPSTKRGQNPVMNPAEPEKEKSFFPSGAIFFFALLLVFYTALWLVIYWLMIARS